MSDRSSQGCFARSSIFDSRFFRTGYATDEARALFCDLRRMQRWLEVEVALAEAQAEMGIIPAEAARRLAGAACLKDLDWQGIVRDIGRTGHSLIPLLSAWRKKVSREHGQYVHFGATTQDVQDTAQILELRDVFAIIERDLLETVKLLRDHALRHRELVTAGRTHGQYALPTTLGLKFAVILDELLRHLQRLDECRPRLLVAQLFGGVGTMAALGPDGLELLGRFAARLGLLPARTCWHAARDRTVEFVSLLALVAGTLGKLANEIYQLARNEIGELEEPFHLGKIGSTTMPHKRNPEICEQVVVLARLIKGNAGLAFDSLISEHERDYRAVRLEWVTVTDSCLAFCGLLAHMKKILSGLIVHEDAVRGNVARSAELLGTEALMFALAERIGKEEAHQLLYQNSMAAYDTDTPLIDVLAADPVVGSAFDRGRLEKILAPENHTGLAARLTEQVADAAAKLLAGRQIGTRKPECPLRTNGGCAVINQEYR